MNINYKQPQFELFPANSALLDDVNKPKFLLANLTLSIENLVILGILGIMLALFSFSLGVERGKHLAAQALDERVSAAWNVSAHKPLASAKPVLPSVQKQAIPAVSQPVANSVQKAKAGNAGVVSSPKPAAAVTAAAKERFTLQVATYKSEEYARKEALAFKAKGFQSFLIKKGDFWLVCLGQFTTSAAAAETLKKVPPKYRSSTVRRF